MNLLITGAWNCTDEQLNEIKRMGHSIMFLQQEKELLPCDYEWVEGVIGNGLFLFHDISKFTNLHYVQTTSTGLDRIPLDYCKAHGIVVHNAKGVYSIPMAEFAISGILDLIKRKKDFFISQEKHEWKKNRDIAELNGMKVLIVGCGSVGCECAKRLSSFDCDIIGVDIVTFDSPYFSKVFPISNLKGLLCSADIILLSVPLNNDTKNLIDKSILSLLKPTTIIVNLARGEVVNTLDLIDALKNKSISGAVLDVFEEEPLPSDSPLWNCDNVIITPHNSFVSDKNSNRLFELIKRNLSDF